MDLIMSRNEICFMIIILFCTKINRFEWNIFQDIRTRDQRNVDDEAVH